MINCDDYIKDGEVERERIALDIAQGKLSYEDITTIISDERIQCTFFGDDYNKKIPTRQWNQHYLDKLSYSVVAEAFNEKYLRYLFDVAQKVNRSKKVKPFIIGGSIALIIALIAVVCLIIKSKAQSPSGLNADSEVSMNTETDTETSFIL